MEKFSAFSSGFREFWESGRPFRPFFSRPCGLQDPLQGHDLRDVTFQLELASHESRRQLNFPDVKVSDQVRRVTISFFSVLFT